MHKILTWDEAFMSIASVISGRSKDPSTQVGATIVSEDNRILSIGYNGTPNGFDDKDFPWGKDSNNPLENKYPYVIHAERNAILNFRGSLREMRNAKAYVTFFPCNECAKEIAQVGIKEVIYLNDHDTNSYSTQATLAIFNAVGIKVRKMEQ